MTEPKTEDMQARVAREEGFFHLTPKGWVRVDRGPYPAERVETWKYELVQPASDAKANVRLTRVWHDASKNEEARAALRNCFGTAVSPNRNRNVVLTCHD